MPPEVGVEEQPIGKTSIGEKYREKLAQLQKPPSQEPTPDSEKKEVATEKKDETPPKPSSALDAALGKEKPVEEKKEAPKWEEAEVLKEFDPKQANWQNARKKLGTQELEIKRLTTEIETAKKQGTQVDPKTIEDLAAVRKENETLKETLAKRDQDIKAINAEYSEDYRALVNGRENTVNKAVKRLNDYGGNGEALREALQLPEGKIKSAQIKEILGELEPEDKTRVLTLVEQIDEANDKIADFKKDLPSKWDEIQKRQDEQTRKKEESRAAEILNNFERIAKTVPESAVLLREIDGDIPGADQWNADVKKAFDNGLRLIQGNGSTFEESAITAIKGSDYDRVTKLLLDTRKELKAANDRLAEFDAATPDFKGGKKPAGQDSEKKSPGQKYRETLSKLQARGDED